MKKIFFMVGFLGLFFYSEALVEAADIQAQLGDTDGTSAFSVLSSTPAEVAYIDSAGNASFNGDATVGDEAVVKGGMRIDSGGTQNTTAETLIVDSKVGIGGTGLTSSLNVGASDEFQVGSDGDLDKIKGVDYTWPASQGAASTFLQTDGSASGNLSWAAPTGASTLKTTADFTNNGTTLDAIPDLSFSVAENTAYTFQFVIVWQTTNSSIGIKFDVDAPASPDYLVWYRETPIKTTIGTDTIQTSQPIAEGGDIATAAAGGANQTFVTRLSGVLSNGANAGTLQITHAAETTATNATQTIEKGSWGIYF